MRRVAIISDAVPERNGVGAYYRDLVDQLDEQGYRTEFICPTGKGEIFSFPLPGDATQRVWLPSLPRFRRILRGLMPETVIVATPGPFGLLGAWWAKRLGARLIVGFHTHFSSVTDLYDNWLLRPLSRFYFRFADRYLFRHGDLVLANSDAMVELAKQLGARQAELMGTLLPTPCRSNPIAPPRSDVRRILFAGRLAPEKRVDTVLAAAEQLPELQFSVAGDGPQKAEVMDRARQLPNLACLGWVSRDQLIQQMDLADVLVLPSYVESFGTVALEAMARQRLALVSANCGILDWSGVNDSLYRIDDGESLTEALRRIVALPAGDRQQLALRAHEAAADLNRRSFMHWRGLIEDGTASCIN